MKKLFLVIMLLIMSANPVFAVSSPTPSTSALMNDAINKQIDALKNKVASKVAELKLVEKRGIIGIVTSTGSNTLTLTDTQGNTRFVDVDELTKFSSDQKDNFGISDIKKGDSIGVVGLYNKDSRRLLARFVDSLTIPTTVVGVVSNINPDDFTITIATKDQKTITADVETVTKSYLYSNDDLSKSGFSKIKAKENIIVFGFTNANVKDKISASKLIHFPGLTADPFVKLPDTVPSPQASIIPSTGSGKKIVPIVH
jgi:hypothetical protein